MGGIPILCPACRISEFYQSNFTLPSPKCIVCSRLPSSRDAIPNPAPPLLAHNSFLLLVAGTFLPWCRSSAGEGSAPLQHGLRNRLGPSSRCRGLAWQNDGDPEGFLRETAFFISASACIDPKPKNREENENT